MTKLKCPYCQQEFREIYFNGVGVGYICPNPSCKPTEHFKGNQELWQALINERQHATDCQDLFIEAIAQKLEIEKYLADTKKKLDIAMDLLEIMNDGLPNGNRWKWEIEKALEQINQKEQQ